MTAFNHNILIYIYKQNGKWSVIETLNIVVCDERAALELKMATGLSAKATLFSHCNASGLRVMIMNDYKTEYTYEFFLFLIGHIFLLRTEILKMNPTKEMGILKANNVCRTQDRCRTWSGKLI